jgi:hypothetical protein
LLYSIDLTPEELDYSRKLSKVEKEIINFLATNGETSVALIIDKLYDYDKEEIIAELLLLYEERRIIGKAPIDLKQSLK